MSPGERGLELRGGGDRGNALSSMFSPPLCHKALHPSFLWHCGLAQLFSDPQLEAVEGIQFKNKSGC